MRLAAFEVHAQRHIGAVDGEGRIVDVSDIVGENVTRLIRQADHMLPQLASALASDQFPSYVDEEIRWLPPVPVPGKICAVATNHSAVGERKTIAHDYPAFFLKPSSCLVGHREPIRLRTYYGRVHPGPGLAVVIGKTARDVDAVDAGDYIFGYTVFNDITGDGRCEGDKASDTFGCMGPWLVTADEVADPDDLEFGCAVGGKTVAQNSPQCFSYKVPELVSFISQFQTLEPGDVICCGAAAIQQSDLQDTAGPVDVHIAGLGTLSNPVMLEDRDIGDWRLPRQA